MRSKSGSVEWQAGKKVSVTEQSVRGGQQGVGVSRPHGSKTKRVLLVEDEPLIRAFILNYLRKAGFEVDFASNGNIALEKLRSGAPDAVFLELMLPDINGVEVIRETRREPETSHLPIYVYTSAFPIATSLWCRRGATVGATKVFDKVTTSIEAVVADLAAQLIGRRPVGVPTHPIQPDKAESEALKEIAAKLPESVDRVHRHLQQLLRCKDKTARAATCGELRSRVHPVVSYAAVAGRYDMARQAAALQSWLNLLREKPKYVTDSSLATVALAVEVLRLLCPRKAVGHGAQSLELSAAVVDDELVSRTVTCSALRAMGFTVTRLAKPAEALRHLGPHRFDLVVINALMPAIGGFDLCKKLRALPIHKSTPVILVTNPRDFKSHARAGLSGPNDVVVKPFIFMELSLKALSLALKYRLPAHAEAPAGTASTEVPKPPVAGDSTHGGPQEQRSNNAVSPRPPATFGNPRRDDAPERLTAPAGAPAGIRESETAQAIAGEEMNDQLQAVSAEAATLRENLEKKRKEREQLVERIFSAEVEMNQLRAALEHEREQRQELQKNLQEMTSAQADLERQVVEWERMASQGRDQCNAAESACREEARRSTRFEDELVGLRQVHDELRAKLATEQQAAAESQQRSEELKVRLRETSEELERARTDLELQAAERGRAESGLSEQLNAAKAAAEKAEAAYQQEAARSREVEEELAGLRQMSDELNGQLAAAQQAAVESMRHREALEMRLRASAAELERVQGELQKHSGERVELESEWRERLNAAKAAAQRAEAAYRHEAQHSRQVEGELVGLRQTREELDGKLVAALPAAAESKRRSEGLEARLGNLRHMRDELQGKLAAEQLAAAESKEGLKTRLFSLRQVIDGLQSRLATEQQAAAESKRRGEELETRLVAVRQMRDELRGKLAAEQQVAAETHQRREELEVRLRETTEKLERAKIELEKQSIERGRAESGLSEQLKAAKAAAEKAEAACQQEAKHSSEVEGELTWLRQVRDALNGNLAQAQKAAGESRQRVEELETGLRAKAEELERAKAELEKQAAERGRAESGSSEELKAAKAAAEKAVAACQQEAQRSGAVEAELAGLRKGREELNGKLAVTQEGGDEYRRRGEVLETELRAKAAELEKQTAERGRAESGLSEHLKTAKAAAEKAEATCQQEAQRSRAVEEELAGLRKVRDELNGKLAATQKVADESRRRGEVLETVLRAKSAELEKQTAERGRAESGLSEHLKAAKAAAGKAEAISE